MKTTETPDLIAGIIAEVHEAKRKLEEKGESANTIRINPAMLEPQRRDAFLAECAKLGLVVKWSKA